MFGPVVRLELLLGSRRGRLDYLRRIYTAWLVLQFSYFFLGYLNDLWTSVMPPPRGIGHIDFNAADRFASAYLQAFIWQQYALLFLLTPAFVAGAITARRLQARLGRVEAQVQPLIDRVTVMSADAARKLWARAIERLQRALADLD